MDLNRIRNMNDIELENYLKGLTRRNTSCCVKCGKINSNYTINVQNKHIFQQKKLCSLCEECYVDMLDNLGVCDIIWE